MASIIDQVRVKLGRLIRVKNTNRKFGELETYIAVQVEDADGSNERCLLFTEMQVKAAEKRAKLNEEDLTTKSFITDLID